MNQDYISLEEGILREIVGTVALMFVWIAGSIYLLFTRSLISLESEFASIFYPLPVPVPN